MPEKILLLVFIHGFQGSEDTFGTFPQHICALLSHRLPQLKIQHLVFPTFETRGDLTLTVSKFRGWLEEQVIDLEVSRGTASPTVEPGVGIIICGHSMGGIVGAEAVCSIAGEKVLEGDLADSEGYTTSLFPYVQGLLAFDTPYLGISPGVVAHGAEGHWKEGKAWYEGAMGVFGAIAGTAAAKEASAATDAKALPPTPPENAASTEKAAQPSWQKGWGRTALLASAGLAATATLGTTAYLKRDTITAGFSWVGSHLQFVGCLARGEELRQRLERTVKVSEDRRLGFANLFTLLPLEKGGSKPGRTFCNLPSEKGRLWGVFRETRNDKANDEVGAHISMFVPKDNPGYYAMSEQSLELIHSWIDKSWSEDM